MRRRRGRPAPASLLVLRRAAPGELPQFQVAGQRLVHGLVREGDGAPFGSGFTTRIAAVSFCAELFDRNFSGSGRRAVTLPVCPGRIEGRVDSMVWLATILLFSSTRTTSSGHVA